MIKNLGGVFGRNPTFNNVEVEGDLTVDGNYVVAGDIAVTGNATITGTLGVTGQITGAAGLKLEDAALNTTILSQDNTTAILLDINSYYAGIPGQFSWLRNLGGNTISIGDLNATNFPMSTVWDCENGSIYSSVGDSSIYIDSAEVTISGVLTVNTATGNISASLNNISASSLTATAAVNGRTIVIGAQSITEGTATATTATLVQTAIVSVVSASTYSSVKYFIQARNTTTSRFQITEIVATRNATTTVITATPVNTNTGGIACTTYAVDISGGNFRLLATPQAASSTIFKVLYTAIP